MHCTFLKTRLREIGGKSLGWNVVRESYVIFQTLAYQLSRSTKETIKPHKRERVRESPTLSFELSLILTESHGGQRFEVVVVLVLEMEGLFCEPKCRTVLFSCSQHKPSISRTRTTTTSNIRPIQRIPAHTSRDTKSGSDDVIQIQHGCLLFYLLLQ